MGSRVGLALALAVALEICASVESPTPSPQQYTSCSDGRSLLRTHLCDGIPHCKDGSDEKYVGPGFKCTLATASGDDKQNRRCVLPQAMVHDDVTDCYDESDECFESSGKLITSRCYRCLDGNDVISLTQVCDGVIDCADLSDECTCVKLSRRRRKFWGSLDPNPICTQIRYSDDMRSKRAKRRGVLIPQNRCNIGEIACKTSSDDARDVAASSKLNQTETTNRLLSHHDDVTLCVTSKQICDGIRDCHFGDDERYCSKSDYKCSGTKSTLGNFCDGRIDCPNFDDECSPDCWLRHDYCDDVTYDQSNSSKLLCQSPHPTNKSDSHYTSSLDYVTADAVCDGVINCNATENDETGCLTSTHFYCREKSPVFIKWTRRYDGVRDCEDGSDECGRMMNISDDSLLQDRDALIRNPILIVFVWVMGIMALGGNAIVIWQASSQLWKDRRLEKLGKLAKCNRIFVVNLAAADFLMGIYLITIGTEAAATDGRYCAGDRVWRSSSTCVALGFINQVSSETSVFMLLLMTTYRLYGTLNPFRVERAAAVQSSVMCCAILWIASVSIAAVPLAETLTDYFSESIWMPLPFLLKDRMRERELREAVIRVNTLTFNKTGRITGWSWTSMLDFLHRLNISAVHPQWNYNSVKPFGHYNWYPNCIPNLYPRYGDTAWAYSAAILIFNFCAFCYITIAYVIIYKASSRPAVRKSVRKRSPQWRHDNKKMQRRIFFLVATDVMCWLPICILFILNLTKTYKVRRGVVDITGSILLPINSAINPLIYSNALWSLFRLIRDKICPRRPRNKFLPFSSFRSKLGSSSSNEVEHITKKRRTVRFLNHDDSTDYSATETMLVNNDVTAAGSDVTNCGSSSSIEKRENQNESLRLCSLETKLDYDATKNKQSPSSEQEHSRTNDHDASGSVTKENSNNGKQNIDPLTDFNWNPENITKVDRETML